MKPLALAALAAALILPLRAQAACRLVTADAPVTMDGLRPLIAAKIGGAPVKLLLDSGAFGSSLTASFAAQRKLPSMTAKAIGSLVPGSASTFTTGAKGHQTQTGIVIAPTFELAHHVYVANSQGKLYFSYSGGPVFRTPAPAQRAPTADPPKP
jgi:hypothetical protein